MTTTPTELCFEARDPLRLLQVSRWLVCCLTRSLLPVPPHGFRDRDRDCLQPTDVGGQSVRSLGDHSGVLQGSRLSHIVDQLSTERVSMRPEISQKVCKACKEVIWVRVSLVMPEKGLLEIPCDTNGENNAKRNQIFLHRSVTRRRKSSRSGTQLRLCIEMAVTPFSGFLCVEKRC